MIHVLLVNTSSLTCWSYTRKVHLSTQSLTAVFLAACIVASQKQIQKVLQDLCDRYIDLFYIILNFIARVSLVARHWAKWHQPTWFNHLMDSFVIKRFSSKHFVCL